MSERFFVAAPLGLGRVVVEGPEAHHMLAACRRRPGDVVRLFNGDGHEYVATLVAGQRRRVTLEVQGVDSPARELPFRMAVAAPVPKGDRGQFLIEKLTELGVSHFVPLQTQRSQPHADSVRPDRLRRHVIEASKQCGRNVLMTIAPPATWSRFALQAGLPEQRLVAHLGGGHLPRSTGRDVVVAVGPEGGFTDEEIALAASAGWQVADLGPRTLRVETAAVVLAAYFSLCPG
ncbi:MAG: 16S rRNA (uracil(1498)-N(3))-methyltransferase [Gemmataceae bacterium]|nr:16S rRNA (uracil(1498)-N(3))-methyltransferase [Gemmataceae bacterium]MDW8266457.1 RsmE family RNA methyltransferase [Gemmataceae bacterium]